MRHRHMQLCLAPARPTCGRRSTVVFALAPPGLSMPRKACALDEQVANLQRRASELQRKISKNVIQEAMKVHPWTITELMSKLESLNLNTTDEKGGKKLLNKDGSVAKLVAPKSFQAEAS